MNRRNRMAKWGRWLIGATVAATLIVAMSLITGCSNGPTSPVEEDQGLSALQFVDQQYGDQVAAVSDSAHASVLSGLLHDLTSLLVGPGGGTLEVELGDHSCTLKIPPGALKRLVRITMGAVQHETSGLGQNQSPWSDATVVEFGPDGLAFFLPAKLTLETDRPEGSHLRIYWWNPVTHAWVFQQAARVTGGCVSFQIRHFSKYGIA